MTIGARDDYEIGELYASFARRLAETPEMDIDAMRDMFDQWHRATAEPANVTYSEVFDAPVSAIWCIPQRRNDHRAIIYTHGGGLVVGSRHSHRKLAGHLATRSATSVLIIEFRRVPEHPHPAQVDDTVAVAKWLIQPGGLSHREVVLAGDSAGGNLAVSAALRLAAEGLTPAAVVALSPWFDMENSGKSVNENTDHDAMINRPTLEVITGLILNGGSPTSPAVNPLYADLSLLPPVFLTASAHELLRDDAVRFAAKAEAAGRDVTLHLEPNAQHVFQMGAGKSTAADRSLEQIGKWLQTQFSKSISGG